MFQKRHYTKLAILMCFILPGSRPFYSAITYSLFLPCSLLAGYLYATVSYVGLLHATWCVNSVCHRFGSRPWNKDILPADNYLVSILTNGEGFHNWHH
jgi:stearoyl-CoA desaturase (delta-9 desaturase)